MKNPNKDFDSLLQIVLEARLDDKDEFDSEELLQLASPRYGNKDVVSFLRELQDRGRGRFIVGRYGKKSRFLWTPDRRGTAAPRVHPVQDDVKRDSVAGASRSSSPAVDATGSISATLHLCSGRQASVSLPANLTIGEADEIVRYVNRQASA